MLRSGLIESLPELSKPVLTVYLDTNREKTDNRALEPAYLTSLGSHAKLTEEGLLPEDRGFFEEQVERAEAFLRSHPPKSKGIVIFTGRESWEFLPLEAAVEDEVHWGAPDLAQLFWLLEEHKPYGVVVVGRKRAQFFLYSMGELLAVEDKKFVLEPSRKKEMGHVARAFGVRMSHGTNRDVFEHHRDAEFLHYYRQIARDMERWCDAEHLQTLFVLGPADVTAAIQQETPAALRENIVSINEDITWLSKAKLQRHIEPIVVKHESQREMAVVDKLLGGERAVVTGLDETLVRLQHGRIRSLVVVKGLDASLKCCNECLWVDRSGDPVCPACGRERHGVSLREVLPELARRQKISMEVVSGDAGRKLDQVGGMGGWLCELERKDYGEHLTFA